METSTAYLRAYKHSPTEDRLVLWVTEERIINLKSILYETVVFLLFIVDKFGTSWHAVTTGKEVLVKLPEYAKQQTEKIIQSLN